MVIKKGKSQSWLSLTEKIRVLESTICVSLNNTTKIHCKLFGQGEKTTEVGAIPTIFS